LVSCIPPEIVCSCFYNLWQFYRPVKCDADELTSGAMRR
jgi:hypothetical protein